MARQRSERRFERILLAICALVLGVTIVYPTARFIVTAAGQWRMETITGGAGFEAIRNTLVVCFASVALAGVFGTALAFLVTRYTFPGRRPLAAMAFLPFALPPLVGTLSFYYLIGHDGFVPRALEQWFGLEDVSFQGFVAILVIHGYSFYVFFYAMVSAALEGMDTSQVEAARTLGAGRWRVFWRVTVPMLTPALLGASLLTFMTSGASFSAPLFFGSDFPVLSTEIYKETSQFREAQAQTLTVVLGLVSLLGVVLFRTRRDTAGSASKGVPRPIRSTSGRVLAGVFAWGTVALLLVPHGVIVWLSLVDHREWYTELFPTVLTFENYTTIFSDASAFRPIRNSLWMSALAAVSTLVVGLPAAYLIGRRKPGGRLVNVLVMIPWALPGTVIAMILITAFNVAWPGWLRLHNTIWILPLGYFVRYIPLMSRVIQAAIAQFDGTLIEAGQTLGGGRAFCFWRIIVPLLAPSLGAATALVFASCLGEFVASILLYTPSNLPIAVQINMQWRGSGVGSAFAYSVFLMALVTATFFTARRFASRVM